MAGQPGVRDQPTHERLVEGSLQLPVADGFGDVDERARRRRESDPLQRTNILGCKRAGAVHSQPRPTAVGSADGDVDEVAAIAQELPEGSRRAMAESGVRAAREHGGHLAPERWQRGVADRIDATVKRVKAVAAQPRLDRARPDAGC
jgi:hypothetical protein